jgi:hypothetical protein
VVRAEIWTEVAVASVAVVGVVDVVVVQVAVWIAVWITVTVEFIVLGIQNDSTSVHSS